MERIGLVPTKDTAIIYWKEWVWCIMRSQQISKGKYVLGA